MKPSEDPRNPFSPNYKAKINWKPQQQAANNQEISTKGLERKRLQDAKYDQKVGMIYNDQRGADETLPKRFQVFHKAKNDRPKQL